MSISDSAVPASRKVPYIFLLREQCLLNIVAAFTVCAGTRRLYTVDAVWPCAAPNAEATTLVEATVRRWEGGLASRAKLVASRQHLGVRSERAMCAMEEE